MKKIKQFFEQHFAFVVIAVALTLVFFVHPYIGYGKLDNEACSVYRYVNSTKVVVRTKYAVTTIVGTKDNRPLYKTIIRIPCTGLVILEKSPLTMDDYKVWEKALN